MFILVLKNILCLILIALFCFGLTWLFFRIFFPLQLKQKHSKLRLATIGTGFFIVYASLVSIYLPMINKPSPTIIINETKYGPVEIDIEQLFYSPRSDFITVPKGFFISEDSSFFLAIPKSALWEQVKYDSAVSDQLFSVMRTSGAMFYEELLARILDAPKLEDKKISKFILREKISRNFILTEKSKIDNKSVKFNPLTDIKYWKYIIRKLSGNMGELLSDTLFTDDELNISDKEIDMFAKEAMQIFAFYEPNFPIEKKYKNSILVLSIDLKNLRYELLDVLGIPQPEYHLMKFASNLEYIIPAFSLGSLQEVVVSSDKNILFARDPIILENILLDDNEYDSLTIEQLYIIAVTSRKGFFVRIQFFVGPGVDLQSWRILQETLRSLRFVNY